MSTTTDNDLKNERGEIQLPVDAAKLLDRIVLHATNEVQKGTDPREIVELIHDATCFWLMNKDLADEVQAERKRKMN